MKEDKYLSTSEINKRLLDTFVEWEKLSLFDKIAKKNNLSRPYVCSVTEKYTNSKNRIMIVGQETYGFPSFDYDWSEQSIQKWGIEYIEKQLWNKGDELYNRSAFWKFFRIINNRISYCPCWNNVDKSHQIIDGKTEPLTVEIERTLNSTVLSNGHTILIDEIDIVKPSVVLFITGPSYFQSMSAAMNIDEKILLSFRPTVECPCTDISEITQLECPVLWTYHPTFLNRNEGKKQLFSKTIRFIEEYLSNL